MITFLPISILAYALNGGSLIIDKILIKKAIPNPLVYTFYISVLQFLVIFLIPFGFTLAFDQSFYLAFFSGITSVIALYGLFTSLKLNEASLVGPVVGSLNPLFTALIGIFLGQLLSQSQYLAMVILIIGTLVLTFNQSFLKIDFGPKFWWMVFSGLMFAISYLLLRETFLQTSFINGMVISRVSATFFAMLFLIPKSIRNDIFSQHKTTQVSTKKIAIMLAIGQIMGASQGFLLAYATSLANPALVNSLFGVQYLVILLIALVLYKKNPHLLDETLTKNVVLQKILGVVVLSFGLYLLSL